MCCGYVSGFQGTSNVHVVHMHTLLHVYMYVHVQCSCACVHVYQCLSLFPMPTPYTWCVSCFNSFVYLSREVQVASDYIKRAATQPWFTVDYSPGPYCKPRKLGRYTCSSPYVHVALRSSPVVKHAIYMYVYMYTCLCCKIIKVQVDLKLKVKTS